MLRPHGALQQTFWGHLAANLAKGDEGSKGKLYITAGYSQWGASVLSMAKRGTDVHVGRASDDASCRPSSQATVASCAAAAKVQAELNSSQG